MEKMNTENLIDENSTSYDILLKEMKNMKEIVFKLSLEQEHTKKLIKEKTYELFSY